MGSAVSSVRSVFSFFRFVDSLFAVFFSVHRFVDIKRLLLLFRTRFLYILFINCCACAEVSTPSLRPPDSARGRGNMRWLIANDYKRSQTLIKRSKIGSESANLVFFPVGARTSCLLFTKISAKAHRCVSMLLLMCVAVGVGVMYNYLYTTELE